MQCSHLYILFIFTAEFAVIAAPNSTHVMSFSILLIIHCEYHFFINYFHYLGSMSRVCATLKATLTKCFIKVLIVLCIGQAQSDQSVVLNK